METMETPKKPKAVVKKKVEISFEDQKLGFVSINKLEDLGKFDPLIQELLERNDVQLKLVKTKA